VGLGALGIPVPTTGANAVFEAGGALVLAGLTMTGAYPVLDLSGTSVSFGAPVNLPAATDFLVSLGTPDRLGRIGVEALALLPGQCGGGGCTSQFFNDTVFDQFPGTTIVVGEDDFAGGLFIGENGPVDIGDKNFIALTANAANVFGLQNILSTGIVAIVSVGSETLFVPPVPTEFTETDEDSDYEDDDGEQEVAAAGEDSGEGGDGGCQGLICEESNAEALEEADRQQCS
jgi:hypothetical protein